MKSYNQSVIKNSTTQGRIKDLMLGETKFGKGSGKLLGFEHLNSVSVKSLKHSVICLSVSNMHLLCIDLWYQLVR